MSDQGNWQTKRATFRERTEFMFNNDLFSDVKFFVLSSDGKNDNKSKRVIPAHKFVLSVSSPVFEAMFYGELAMTSDSIELPDCEYESLLEFFRYLYSDEVNLCGSNVMGVLHLAKKYMVPSLADKCAEYLVDNVDPLSVFNVLPSALNYEEEDLIDACWRVVDEQTEAALKSDGFATIERSLLEAIAIRDTLFIDEVDLFRAVDFWATRKCQMQGTAAEGESKRKILGERIVKSIRLPVINQEQFSAVVLDAKILTPEEVVLFFQFFSSTLTSPIGFPESKRSGIIYRCRRFDRLLHSRKFYATNGFTDYINFVIDRDIVLYGIYLCGSEDRSHSVSMKVINCENNCCISSRTGIFSSRQLKYSRDGENYFGYEVSFDPPVHLKKNMQYQIEAFISGPESGYGLSHFKSLFWNGVTFTFSTSHLIPCHGTTYAQGQFAEFVFSLYRGP